MRKIDLKEIQSLKSTIDTNLSFTVKEYKNKTRSLNSRLNSITGQYRDYSEVTSKIKEMQKLIGQLEKMNGQIEKDLSKILKGLGGIASEVYEEEQASKKVMNASLSKPSVSKGLLPKTPSSSIFQQPLSYADLLNENMKIKVQAYKSEKEKLEVSKDLGREECQNKIKELLSELNGKVQDGAGFYSLDFEGDLNEAGVYDQAVWEFLAAKGLTTAYDLLEEDELTRDRLLAYWLELEKQGKDLKQNPVPDWWLADKKPASEVFKVTEENYDDINGEAFEYYFNNLYLIDIIKSNGEPIICDHFFTKWFEEQYGHLNPNSHEVKRLKYEISQGLLVDLKNDKGLYDNEETQAYKNARDLWLNLKGVYKDYWDSKAIFTSNNKILQKIIDKIREKGELGIESFQNPDYEQLIIDGEYRLSKDFLTRLEQGGIGTVVKNEDGTMTITLKTIIADGVTIDDLQWGYKKIDDLPVKEYSITVDCFDYMGETYIDSKEFDKKYEKYQSERLADGSYLNDIASLNNYSMYADEARIRLEQLQDKYPDADISFEQVMAMLRMEDERLALYKDKKTDSERIQDAGQAVLDIASIALACGGFPEISAALEAGNAITSGTRENYDDMNLRLIGLCLYGVGEYLKYADTGAEIGEEILRKNAQKLTQISSNEIDTVVNRGEKIVIKLKDGTEIVCARTDLTAADLIKLKTAERAAEEAKNFEKIVSQIKNKTSQACIDQTESFNSQLKNILSKHDISMDKYKELSTMAIEDMSEDQIKLIYTIRQEVMMPDNNTLMSKVITESTAQNCINNGEYSDSVVNCLAKASDTSGLKTYEDYFNTFGLDYPGSEYMNPSKEKLSVLRFTTDDVDNIKIPYGGTSDAELDKVSKALGIDKSNLTKLDPPFQGNGITKNAGGGLGAPEFTVSLSNPIYINEGAAIYDIDRFGVETLRAVYTNGQWIEIKAK